MDTKIDLSRLGIERLVYVRTVAPDDLPEDMRAEIDGTDPIYAIHSEDGERLAFVKNRELAFAVARTNDFTPVSVH